MKTALILILSFLIMPLIHSQNKLYKVENSCFYTDNTKVYYVVANINSSGILAGYNGKEILETATSSKAGLFEVKPIIISKAKYINEYGETKQHFNTISFAIELDNSSLQNFKVLNKNYGIHATNVYYKYFEIEKADSKSFTIVLDKYYEALSKDKNHVFFRNSIVADANPNTFEVINQGNFYAKDKQFVFYRGHKILHADPKTFKINSHTYQTDKNHVWIVGQPSKIDRNSFMILECTYPNTSRMYTSLYAVDKDNLYFQGKIIKKADPKTFKILLSDAPYQIYGIDSSHVFYNGQEIEIADSKTFTVNTRKQVGEMHDASDKNYSYERAKPTQNK